MRSRGLWIIASTLAVAFVPASAAVAAEAPGSPTPSPTRSTAPPTPPGEVRRFWDQATRIDARYHLRADGVIEATETIDVIRTGNDRTLRQLTTRAYAGSFRDRVVEVSAISVRTPAGAETPFETYTTDPLRDDGGSRWRVLTIGLEPRAPYPAAGSRETYVLRYELRHALRRDVFHTWVQFEMFAPPQEFAPEVMTVQISAAGKIRDVTRCVWFSQRCRRLTVLGGVARMSGAPTDDGTVRGAASSDPDLVFNLSLEPGAVTGDLEPKLVFRPLTGAETFWIVIAVLVIGGGLVVLLGRRRRAKAPAAAPS